jgi:hypothetical protein
MLSFKQWVRFLHKVDKRSSPVGCWLWRGATGGKGDHIYGVFRLGKGKAAAHRLCYEQLKGRIPEGHVLDHVCPGKPNKLCVNPDHLEPKTQADNLLNSEITVNAINAGKTHCKNGHEFDAANTYVNPRTGRRQCRRCSAIVAARSRGKVGDELPDKNGSVT